MKLQFSRALLLAFFLSVFLPATTKADTTKLNFDCQNFTALYDQALDNYIKAPSLDSQVRLELERLKKRADRQLRICTKLINRSFKEEIKRLKENYPKVLDSKEQNLSNKAKKDAGIAAASLERDRKIQVLPKVRQLP
jgi:hypothetical protein